MAQYYQVVSEGDNAIEELRQLYPNVLEDRSVQYVINPEDHQQFQPQQIVVASDQLMVVEDQSSQQVIIDQSAINYTNSQYILQDSLLGYRDPQQQQQILYMEKVEEDRTIQNEPQPLVVNNQIQSCIRNLNTTNNAESQVGISQQQLHHIEKVYEVQCDVGSTIKQQKIQVQQYVTQLVHVNSLQQSVEIQNPDEIVQRTKKPEPPVRQSTVVGSKTLNVGQMDSQSNQSTQEMSSLHQIKQSDISEADGQQAVALADGRIMMLSDYKRFLLAKKKQARPSQVGVDVPLLIKHNSLNQNCSRIGSVGGGKKSNLSLNINSVAHRTQNNDVVEQPRYIRQKVVNNKNVRKLYSVHEQFSQSQQQQLFQQQKQEPHQSMHQLQTQQIVQQPQYLILSSTQQQTQQQRSLPGYIHLSQIQEIIQNTPMTEEFSNSIRMIILLENGEQRFITFTIPKEQCTIQEILEQVGISFLPETPIECIPINSNGINYLVTIGKHNLETLKQEEELEISSQEFGFDTSTNSTNACESSVNTSIINTSSTSSPTLSSIDEDDTPLFKPGLLAVCNHCGYTSENFKWCLRCKYKLPDDVKTRPALSHITKTDHISFKTSNGGKRSSSPFSRKKKKAEELEPVILTLSSDEESEESEKSQLSKTDQIIKKMSTSAITLSAIKKEPSMSDIQQNATTDSTLANLKNDDEENSILPDLSINLRCRTIRIGSYRFVPTDPIEIKTQELILKAPALTGTCESKTIIVKKKDIIKVLVNFQKLLPVVFYYVTPSVGQNIRNTLGMIDGSDTFFDPLSTVESFKRITILPDYIGDETKKKFKGIYRTNMEELTTQEANDILIKTCPKELTKVISNAGYTEIKQLLIYPPGRGGLSINTEDYLCLAQDQFLNDVIIDFYLKYLVLNLPKEEQERIHVFSTFFYKRLTTKPIHASRRALPSETNSSLTPAQKRHSRVEKWTKNVNLFEKDFVIIPINENCHWFLAIICFPGLDGCVTMDGKCVVIEPKECNKAKKKLSPSNVTITPVKIEKPDDSIPCDEGEASDKDEAEGDESELDSDGENTDDLENSDKIPSDKNKKPAIKQSCILIFDSLAGASRARVVATLRDYLSCEYKAKMAVEKMFNKTIIKGSCPKVPQQTNFTDCGLYLLQYVEQFLKDPLQDYRIPLKLKNWFSELVVTKKREDISVLIKRLMLQYNKDPTILPVLQLPTLNGELLAPALKENDDEFLDEFDEEEEELLEAELHSDVLSTTGNTELLMDEEIPMTTTPVTSPIRITLSRSKEEKKKKQINVNQRQRERKHRLR